MNDRDRFDRARQAFLVAHREFLDDPAIPDDIKQQAVTALISAMRQIMTLAGLSDAK